MTTIFALAVPVLGAAGCGDEPNNAENASLATPSTQITEAFSGTVSVNGAATFNFSAVAAGAVTASLKSITPATAAVMGLALGTWNGISCQIVIASDAATASAVITGQASAAGALCVRAYDIGKLTATQTVEITVTHF